MILAVIARHTVTGTLEGARQGYRVARSELGEAVPPHTVDSALGVYRNEGRGANKGSGRLARSKVESGEYSAVITCQPSAGS